MFVIEKVITTNIGPHRLEYGKVTKNFKWQKHQMITFYQFSPLKTLVKPKK